MGVRICNPVPIRLSPPSSRAAYGVLPPLRGGEAKAACAPSRLRPADPVGEEFGVRPPPLER